MEIEDIFGKILGGIIYYSYICAQIFYYED